MLNPKAMRWASWGVGVLALGGCRANPIPDAGILSRLAPVERPVAPAYGLKAPQVTEFTEGQPGRVQIEAYVPGTRKMRLEGLPTGAVFDETKMLLSWQPDYQAANDPQSPQIIVRTYTVKVLLWDAADPSVVYSQDTALVVKDSPRPMQIQVPSKIAITEGKAFSGEIVVTSPDYPNGPFEILTEGLPDGATISPAPNQPSRYLVRYTPSYRVVANNDYMNRFDIKVTAVAPNLGRASDQVVWSVYNDRQKARVSAPKSLVQGLDVTFTVHSEDLNGEAAPQLSIVAPTLGKATLTILEKDTTVPSDRNPAASAMIRWTDLPQSFLGTQQTLTFKSCVLSNLCQNHLVPIQFSQSPRKAPMITRDLWPMGVTRFVKLGQSLQIPVLVQDGDGYKDAPAVSFQQGASTDQLSYVSGEVRITPALPGLKQVNLVATSAFGVVSVEPLSYEVLPSDWSSVLTLTDSPRDMESRTLLGVLPQGSALGSPAVHLLDERILSFRSQLVLGTSVLSDTDSRLEAETAIRQIKNVLVASPLAANVTADLARELAYLGVRPLGRLLDLKPTPPALADFRVLPTMSSNLAIPIGAVTLSGTLTSESANPLVWDISSSRACKVMVSLSSPSPLLELPLVIQCDRAGGGKLTLSGFEPGDVKAAASDLIKVKSWFHRFVNP